MKIALIGAGRMAGAHIGGLARHGDVGVFALEGAEEFSNEHGVIRFDSLDEIFKWADFVDVCTPTDSHFEVVRAALEAGLDVICEKPLCRTSAEALELERLANTVSRHVFPAHVVRYFPAYVTLKEAVDAGRLGELATLRFTRTGTFPAWSPWFADYERSGGLIMDLMIHDFDQAVWLAGPVEAIYASQVEEARGEGRWSTAHCVLTHSSGALSYVRGLWGAPNTSFATSFHVAGTRGFMEYNSFNDQFVTLNGSDQGEKKIMPLCTGEDPYAAQIAEFIGELTGEGKARVVTHDGTHAVELAEAAIESIRTGHPVRIEKM